MAAVIITSRDQRRRLKRDNAAYSHAFVEISREAWPRSVNDPGRLRVWRNRDFLVQEFKADGPALVRLSINRTSLSGDRWTEGITWDELQAIKAAVGYPFADAVEIYPSVADEVNVANMRHLWVMREPISFAWRRS